MASRHDIELGHRGRGIPRDHRDNSRSEQTLGQMIAEVGMPDVLYNPHRDAEEWIINLGNLHRMTMYDLQREIVEQVARIRRTETVDAAQLSMIRTTLSSYASSIRDWELMVTYGERAGGNPSLDPFIITSTRLLDLCLMNNAGITQASRNFAKDLQEAINNGDTILPPVRSRTRKNLIRETKAGAFWKRLYMAIFGGFAVVGPMLLMVLYKHILTSLLTTSLAVFLFALAMATFSTANPETVLAVVAAYAAVLVVFVGTSS